MATKAIHIFCMLLCLSTFQLWGQGAQTVQQIPGLQVALDKLKLAYERNADLEIASASEEVGDCYVKLGQQAKAEPYFERAGLLFKRLNRQEDMARALRSLAKSQEAQQKTGQALLNFQEAGTVPDRRQELNINDVTRLRNSANPQMQQSQLNSNVGISQKIGSQTELADAYRQLGDLSLQQNKVPEALKNYGSAIAESDQKDQALQMANTISQSLSAEGKYDEAIVLQQKLMDRPDLQSDVPAQINQYQQIADIFVKKDATADALNLLRKSYELALLENRTLDAKNSLERMADIYLKQGDRQASIDLYRRFLSRMDSLLLADPTIVDVKLLSATEERIKQLESERILQDRLMDRKARFNLALMAASVLLFLLLLGIAASWYAIRQKNRKIALQSLRREMNPHFVFNSLNSVNQFIAQNNELAANKFLSAYSGLMRRTMENASKDFLPLSAELDMLTQYLDLEKMRFPEKFDFEIRVSEDLDPDLERIPNMLLQPHLENAIWHGLRYKDEKGWLRLEIFRQDGRLRACVEDNGIGLSQSKALKTMNQRSYESRGLNNIRERIQLLNQIYGTDIRCEMLEKEAPFTGTRVELYL